MLSTPRLQDELLSSWLVRLAMVQGCDPLVLTSFFWPHRRVWTTDLDRGTIGPPAACAGLSASDFSELTLGWIASRVAHHNGRSDAVWPWILAAGCRNRRRHGGLQFCPACLAADARPYYRRRWRLAWHTSCLKHNCSLMDSCGLCGVVPEPHRLTLASPHIALCANCGADFRTQISRPCNVQAVCFQQRADEAVERGEACYGNATILTAEWFRLARFVVALLRAAGRKGHQPFSRLFAQLGVEQGRLRVSVTGLPLELLPIGDRMGLLALTCQILDVEPGLLVNAALSSGLTRGALLFVGGQVPSCLEPLIAALPQSATRRPRKASAKRRHPRPRGVIEQMVARLKRKIRP
ncbi:MULTISPECIES: TniQ family protein [Pseudomonas aeruginosa group]|uniref:TniQ family protein n=1 Tax=Pseudomonas aeruginosa group TaxID=136841 RepID=UPI0008FB72F6|nr:TniQ family protein [Pseudomonas aeruginosa]OPD67277.1 hypothetical protein AO882_32325 [Pseudomonas paraeruginosa]MBH9343386.1 TniQ family protein [Pseudomonas aeruginosa]MBH9397877.1 TniQ family protein [Pseudomonas aeruginosa]MBI8118483.1 TniQ family protein [Pseudomonas aeruginosa]